MRKAITLLLTVFMALALTACSAAEPQTALDASPTDEPLYREEVDVTNAGEYVYLTFDAELLRSGKEIGDLSKYASVEIRNVLPSDFDAVKKLELDGVGGLTLVMDAEYLSELYNSDEPTAMLRGKERKRFEKLCAELEGRYDELEPVDLQYANARDKELMKKRYVKSCCRADLPLTYDRAESYIEFDSRMLTSWDTPETLDYQVVVIDMNGLWGIDRLPDIHYEGTELVQLNFYGDDDTFTDAQQRVIEDLSDQFGEKYPDIRVSPVNLPRDENAINVDDTPLTDEQCIIKAVKGKQLTVHAQLVRRGGELPPLREYGSLEIAAVLLEDFDAIAALDLSDAKDLIITMDADYLAQRYGSSVPVCGLSPEDRTLFRKLNSDVVSAYPQIEQVWMSHMNSRDLRVRRSEYVVHCSRADMPLKGDFSESNIEFDSRLLASEDCPALLDYTCILISMQRPEELKKLLDIDLSGVEYMQINMNDERIIGSTSVFVVYSLDDYKLARDYEKELNERYPDMQLYINFPVG